MTEVLDIVYLKFRSIGRVNLDENLNSSSA